MLLATLATNTVVPYDHDHLKITPAQVMKSLAADVNCRIVGTPILDIPALQRIDELEEDSTKE